jgi:pyruvate formate lyase activating enzyme
VIVRDRYEILDYALDADGHCEKCGGAIAGRYDSALKSRFGPRRIPVRLAQTI